MTKNWKDVRPEIKRLYVTQKRVLEEVRELMKNKHGFTASLRAYKNKIDEWGWKKYKKLSRVSASKAAQALAQDGVSALSSVDVARDISQIRGLEEMLARHRALAKSKKESRPSLYESAHPDPSNKGSVEQMARCNKTIARIERTIRSLEAVLASIATQINTPTGFASCWRQQPMLLEDAHGTFIPIPLDIVVTWQIFEDIVQSHFRKLPGGKKVAKREYAIEDSATCTKFSRDYPWTSFCKAGLKIDMSMIFSDKSKTSVTCPKCDMLSSECKGVMVECKNPGCKMLFRTEEEDDNIASQLRRSQPRSSDSVASPLLLSSIPCQDEDEDKPGLFKRVIIRIAKHTSMITDQHERERLHDRFSNPFPLFSDTYGFLDPLWLVSDLSEQFSPYSSSSFESQPSDIPKLPRGETVQFQELIPLAQESVHWNTGSKNQASEKVNFRTSGPWPFSNSQPNSTTAIVAGPFPDKEYCDEANFDCNIDDFPIDSNSMHVTPLPSFRILSAQIQTDTQQFDQQNYDMPHKTSLRTEGPGFDFRLNKLQYTNKATNNEEGTPKLSRFQQTALESTPADLSSGNFLDSITTQVPRAFDLHQFSWGPVSVGDCGFHRQHSHPTLIERLNKDSDGSNTSSTPIEQSLPLSLSSENTLLDPKRQRRRDGWAGIAVGHHVRDDLIMAEAIPFPVQSPSYYPSSYLPKLEANPMREFACCGKTLPTLHDLLQHYEEYHSLLILSR